MKALRAIALMLGPVLLAGPAAAETAFLSLVVGAERIDARPDDIAGSARDADGALLIRLDGSFDARVPELTGRHPGARARLLLCGEVLVLAALSAPITTAVFTLNDPAGRDRAEARLRARSCDPD